MAGPFDDTLGAGFPAQQDQAGGILKILSAMKPQDPAAVNPATTAAMAQSRDAVTRMLQRQLKQMDSPFAGLSDVATAAQTALATRGKTPVGATLESLDQNRISKATQIANTLSQVANREAGVGAKGQTTPYQAAQLAMSQLRFLAQRGDKDAQLAENAIDNIRTNLDPEDAVGFVVDAHSALQEAQRRAGRGLTGQEAAMVVTETARSGKYKPKQVGVSIVPDAFGRFHRTDNRAGTVTEVTPGIPGAIPSPGGRLPPPVGSPPPAIDAPPAGPPPGATTTEPVLGGRVAQAPVQQPQAAPTPNLTLSQQGAQAIDRRKADVEFQAFRGLAEDLKKQIAVGGAQAMGPSGWVNRFVGAMAEQARGLAKSAPDAKDFNAIMADQRLISFMDGFVERGAQSSAIKAGILTFAYRYSKASDPTGPVNRNELEHALNVMGEVWGSPTQVARVMDTLIADAERKRNLILGAQPAGQPQAAPARTTAMPEPGKVEVDEASGMAYQFMGGDPGNKANWKLIK